jgi:hypothetical protein
LQHAKLETRKVLQLGDRALAVRDVAESELPVTRPISPFGGSKSNNFLPIGPSTMASASFGSLNMNGKSTTANSFETPTSKPALSTIRSSVPPCNDETFAMSPPSVPPGKSRTSILPPLFCLTSSMNFSTPWPCGCCALFWCAKRSVCGLISCPYDALASASEQVATSVAQMAVNFM